jgi:hypothetical protein
MAQPHIYFFFKKMTTTTTLECMVCYQEIKFNVQCASFSTCCHLFHKDCLRGRFSTECPFTCKGLPVKIKKYDDLMKHQQKRIETVCLKNHPTILPGNVIAAQPNDLDDLQKLFPNGDTGKRGKSLDNHKGTTPLQTAIRSENLQAVTWLFDKDATYSYGLLHCAAQWTKKNKSVLDFLLQNIAIDDKNRIFKTKTPLDYAYLLNKSKIKNEIIALMRKNDCKANWYNEDGVKVGKGLGDLNPSEGALKSVETD